MEEVQLNYYLGFKNYVTSTDLTCTNPNQIIKALNAYAKISFGSGSEADPWIAE